MFESCSIVPLRAGTVNRHGDRGSTSRLAPNGDPLDCQQRSAARLRHATARCESPVGVRGSSAIDPFHPLHREDEDCRATDLDLEILR